MTYKYPRDWKTYTGEDSEGGSEGIDLGHKEPFHVDSWLVELVKSIRNRCDVVLAIQGFDDLQHSIPTILEDLYGDAQAIMDEYCIAGIDEDKRD